MFKRYFWDQRSTKRGVMALLSIGLLWGCNSSENAPTDASEQHTTWKDYGGGPDQSKYMALSQINKSNVKELKEAWFYPTGDNKVYQFNPIVVDTVMYVLAKDNSLVALNAKTGKEIWIHANLTGMARRGINYWESKDGKDRRLIFQINNYLEEIDANTGKSILTFGENGLVDLRQGLNRDPNTLSRAQSGTPGKIFEDLLILGTGTGESYMSTPGYLRAFNVITGELAWTFHTIPLPGEYGYDTWPKDAYKYVGGVNTWGEISVDEKRGIAYFPLGSPTFDYYGADRKGSNLFGNCILALDARTGKRLWHFQTVHHDIWDYDLTAAPQLLTIDHEGKKVDVVAVAGKIGFVYVLNRETGEPIWPIEERPVPPSEVEGEEAWPTQPFPTVIPPASKHKMTKEDLSQVYLSDAERKEWEQRWDSIGKGFFTPLSDKRRTLSIPGAVGGVNWGNTASDPAHGLLYVISINYPSYYEKLLTQEQIEARNSNSGMGANSAKMYQQNCAACHGQERTGLVGPSLIGLGERLKLDEFNQLLVSGRGDMPSFAHLKPMEMMGIYAFLTNQSVYALMGNQKAEVPSGPVVAVGGAPGGLEPRKLENVNRYGGPYPDGVEVPHERFYLHQWGLEVPYIINPPWSEIMAYDLNKGTLKWKRPLGEDLEANKKGFKNTGMLRAQRNGMVITSTGLVFSTAKDGKIRAFDADNGNELWSADLPKGTEGLPALYELDGKEYLVVPATSSLKFGRGDQEGGEVGKDAQGGYMVFALPDA